MDKFRFYSGNFKDDLNYFEKYPLQLEVGFSFDRYSNFSNVISILRDEINLKNNCSALIDLNQRVQISDYVESINRLINEFKKEIDIKIEYL